MVDQQLITGIKIKLPQEFDRLCSSCAEGKAMRPPLPDTSKTQYDLNELLVMDITGPMSVITWDGNHYAMVTVEASKRYPAS